MSATAQTLQQAVERHNAGDNLTAESLCREVLRIDPAHSDALYLLGVSQAARQQWNDAVACFERLAEMHPNSADVQRRLAEASQQAGRLTEAVAAYGRLVKLAPDDVVALNELGILLQQAGETEAAGACFQQAVSLQPGFVPALRNQAVLLLLSGQPQAAVEALREGREQAPREAELAFLLGLSLEQLGRPAEARQAYQQAVENDAAHLPARFALAESLRKNENYAEAAVHLQEVLRQEPAHAAACLSLAEVFTLLNRPADALPLAERAVELLPDNPAAYSALGNVLREEGQPAAAIAAYRRALQLNPSLPQVRFLLAKTLAREGRFEEAVREFETARQDAPQLPYLAYHLGNCLKSLGRYEEALSAYQEECRLRPGFQRARYELGNTLRNLHRYEEACRCYEEVLQHEPDNPTVLIARANVLKTMDEQQAAAETYEKVLHLLPHKERWEMWIAALCPAVFESAAAIADYRRQLHARLTRLAEKKVALSLEEISANACPVPYNLQFHGCSNRSLKEAYSRVYEFPEVTPLTNSGRPRVGFVVTAGHEGPFLRFLGNVLRQISLRSFEVVVCCNPQHKKTLRQRLQRPEIPLLELPTRFDAALHTLREARFDLLYYWEVGSDTTNYFLPFFRLAPVQCTGAGLPDTSGVPCLDYFLSSDVFEPQEAEQHYSERLIRAGTLLQAQSRMTPPDKLPSREELGLPATGRLYLCPHKIEKLHPDFDAILGGILRDDGAGRLLIPADRHRCLSAKLEQRFRRTLPDVAGRIEFLPRQSFRNYLGLIAAADVVLDTLHYGGGLTSYDVLSLNRPMVTLPGEFCRGRFTAGFYRQMGLTECIADSAEDYVKKAVRLATDAEYRRSVERQIQQASDLLFEDTQAVREYEQIFAKWIAEARGN